MIDAVGSAREIERLCQRDLAYMWLCGDVRVNHHALADFRSADNGMADRILAQSIMALQAEGTVQLETLAVDGVRVRAHAGQASFRRRPRIEAFEREAEERVALLKAGALPDAGPDAGQGDSPGAARDKRQQAAAMRAAEERAARIAAARTILAQREEQRQKRSRSNRKKTAGQGDVRVSTSDPECRVMKMADGGFRPAYNLQVTTDPFSGIIVATAIDCSGSDKGLLRGAVQAATLRHGRAPKAILADGGFSAASDIEWAHALATGGTGACPAEEGPTLYVPLTASKHGTDPHAPRKDDGPGVAALRLRMASDDGKASYKLRCQTELPHARLRKNGLNQFTLRGAAKALAQATWHAIANNLIIVFGIRSRRAAA